MRAKCVGCRARSAWLQVNALVRVQWGPCATQQDPTITLKEPSTQTAGVDLDVKADTLRYPLLVFL